MNHLKRRGRPRLFSFASTFKPVRTHADTDSVSVTLNPPTRVAALVGALVLTGLAAPSSSSSAAERSAETRPAPRRRPRRSTKPAARADRNAEARRRPTSPDAPRVVERLPAKIDHALRYSRVVVVSVSMPGRRGRRDRQARGSRRGEGVAGRVRRDQRGERARGRPASSRRPASSPLRRVVIVKRPGVVATTFSVTDAGRSPRRSRRHAR